MPALGILHVNLEVTDLDRALVFYRTLGLEEAERQGTPGRRGAWLRFPDGRELHLSLGPAPVGGRAHVAIRVSDLTALQQRFESLGAPIEQEREIPGVCRFFTRDPDGNRLEIVAEPSPAAGTDAPQARLAGLPSEK